MAAAENQPLLASANLPGRHATSGRILDVTQLWYAPAILATFIACALGYSIYTAQAEEDIITPSVRGPGGKPLPVTKRKKSRDSHAWDFRLPDPSSSAKRCFQCLTAGVVLSFLASIALLVAHAKRDNQDLLNPDVRWSGGESTIVYYLGSTSLYAYFVVSLFEWDHGPGAAHFAAWLLGFIGEVIILLCRFLRVDYCKVAALENRPVDRRCVDGWTEAELGILVIRTSLVFGLCAVYSFLWLRTCCRLSSRHPDESDDEASGVSTPSDCSDRVRDSDTEESTPLLRTAGISYNTHHRQEPTGRAGANGNGNARRRTNGAAETGCVYKDESAAFYRPEKIPKRNWWEYLRTYTLFWPYLWPRDSYWLQLRIFVCFLLLVAQRGVNIMLPWQIGRVTDRLSGQRPDDGDPSAAKEMPWVFLWTLNTLLLLQGQSGLLNSFRSIIWIKVSQFSYKSLETAAFQHVHTLSLDFHLGKRTGEVLSALNKGGAINSFLEQVTFQLVPMIVDLFLAIYFFNTVFDATYGVLVSINTFWYLYLTIKMAQTRVDQRREMTNADREEEAVKNDSITSYETVKYFNAEQYEFRRYKGAIDNFQRAEAKVYYGMNFMAIVQSVAFTGGLAVALMVGAYQVSNGYRTVGDFITLMSYLTQMQTPLNFFSQFYRTIQQALISGERLLELFKIQPSVIDHPQAKELQRCEGYIRWTDVRFSYADKREALRDLNFECVPGSTTAFVGESGGGKSTVFRLMFRYYNCTHGSIEIDGQDVVGLTMDSVRRFIGVVPQDTILFNETLMYNLKYANPKAKNQDVFEACKAASIHDRIMSFPDQYDTKVGERGLRLSGGEKQRVAIARTILKNPKIIMLDEATSALDSHTEQKVQTALGNLGEGRTLLIIAHRLSTITHADQIIVLHAGQIVEKGTHEELIALKGRYASMWEKQIRAERAAEAARVASRKAQRLMRQANIVAKKQSGSPSDGYNSMTSSAILPGPSDPSSKPNSPTDEQSSDGESAHTYHGDSDRH